MTAGLGAAFLDRDGTINREHGYVTRPEDLELLDCAPGAIRALNEGGVPVVVISNQSGVARGLMTEADLSAVQAAMEEMLLAAGARIDAAYYCPNHTEGTVARYSREAQCRKPALGMLEAAVRDLGIDASLSTMVGDQVSDIEFANRGGMAGVMVLTGKGEAELELARARGLTVAASVPDLAAAADWILKERPAWTPEEQR